MIPITRENTKPIDGRQWTTPLTHLPPTTVGTARLSRSNYRGLYHYEGIEGFAYWQTKHWLPVRGLQQKHGRKWQTWMVDDPVHWNGMREAVSDLPDGKILVAGLGLGLMLHHMAQDPRFTAITVVEYNPDVIALIQPTLPPDPRVTIVPGDFYRYLASRAPAVDGVLWDLAVGKPHETLPAMMRGEVLVRLHLGAVPLVMFGIRRT